MLVAALACTLIVSNPSDAGPGSLRDAIEEVNRRGPAGTCTIAFEIAGAVPWHTIRPERPLPAVRFRVAIDGDSQRRFGGDSNPDGPEIELDGSALSDGSGLVVCAGEIAHLAINRFPGNGITVGGPECNHTISIGTIHHNYVGIDPTGRTALPNARGIWLDARVMWDRYTWDVHHNVVSGNRWSGIFVSSGAHRIHDNVIGLTPKVDAGLGNGSSGVAILGGGYGTDVDDNYIGFNGHFGVGIARNTRGIALKGNSFQANHIQAIDWGFDGPTPKGIPSFIVIPPVPEITSVHRENDATIVEGLIGYACPGSARIYVYANDVPHPSGYGEGQYVLGATDASPGGRFTFRYPGDLRGKWIAATNTCSGYYALRVGPAEDFQGFASTTSEFGRSVEVK